jgi:hypothetical protein
MQLTTPSKYAKESGLKNLKEVQEITGVNRDTLVIWFKTRRSLFDVIILGCLEVKSKDIQIGD